jgi:integrase
MNVLQSRKSKAGKWPAKVTCGNTTVSVYRRKMPNGSPGFMVADFSTGKRRFISFTEPGPALAEAERIARLMAAGEAEAAAMAGPERASYGRAVELLRETGVSLEVAAATFAECCNVLHGNRLLEACKFYAARHRQVTRKPVADLVADFIALRESRGASERYLRDLKSRLGKFAADCRKDASDVSTADVQAWLDSLKAAPQTVKNFRTVLFTLFEHAVARGFAHDNPVAGSEVGKVRGGEIEIFTPAEFRKLLAAAKPDFLPLLAIGGLAGLRSAELERLEWGDIDLARRCIVVGASKAKTASRRVVPVCDALAAWLAPYAGQQGKLWPYTEGAHHSRQRETAKDAKLKWRDNALRHSYASYRFAELGDAGRVAGELGNSAAVVHRHYRELVKPDDAKAWFAIRPEAPANVVEMRQAEG